MATRYANPSVFVGTCSPSRFSIRSVSRTMRFPQPLTPSLSIPPLCQTPGCRRGRNRSTLSPSHPVLSVLHHQGFRKRFASAAARRSFGGASPPTNVFSFATSSQCSHTRLSQGGHGCRKSSDGLASCAVPRLYEARLGGVRCGAWRSVPGEGSTYCIHTSGPRLPPS